ncbi:hypothetical protein BGX24_010919 [Mortierella sp. AD032]|nr:hypothetical protein BGX24_010919 [Mortierella sp. AD032]
MAVSFGQTTGSVPMPMGALGWVEPLVGNILPGFNITTTGLSTGQPLAARAGHTMVQYKNNNLWVIGGYQLLQGNGIANKPVDVASRDTPMYDYSARTWSNQTKIGLYRYGHASAKADGENILSFMKTMFQSTTLIWSNLADEIQDGLIGHTLVASIPDNGILFMYGGTSEDGKVYNQDVYRLDTTTLPKIAITKIARPAAASLLPSARAQHAAAVAGTNEGFMIIQGGMTGPNVMADSAPHFFHMKQERWLDQATFAATYIAQLEQPAPEVSAWVVIAGIITGVAFMGVCVGMYIWRGIRKDTARRLEREAADRQSISPDFAAAAAAAGHGENRRSSGGYSERGSTTNNKSGRTPHPIYGMMEEDDHSISNGPCKSTSSLIQSDEFGKSGIKKTKSKGDNSNTCQSNHSKPWVTEPASPGGTTLTENGSINGYFSSNSSQTPSRLNKKGSNASSQNSMATRNNTPSGNNSNNNNSNRAGGGTSDAYYNPRDLYVDEDDDSSITVSLASESSTMSPWTGPVRVSTDLAPPNPRFSRGAIPQAHRQLVDAIATNASAPMPTGSAYSFTSNRNSNGWDTSSPGGSLSSRDDEYNRRSVNSMQWVSFEPADLAGRPESQNASMYRTSVNTSQPITIPTSSYYNNNTSNNPRMSMFGGSNTSDTNTEDSGSYSGPGGKRISTALAARQQRRSIRNSQDSLSSANGRHHSYQQQQQQQQQMSNISGNNTRGAAGEEEVFVTKVLPIITNKVTKPTLAKVVTQQRGSRVVVPSSGPLSDQRSPSSQPSEEGGLGIDFSGFSTSQQDGYMSGYGSNNGGMSNSPHRTSYQTRRTSNLNPNKLPAGSSSYSRQHQQQRDSTNVILKMPPAPKHGDTLNNNNLTPTPRSREQQQGNTEPGVRNSILEMGQDLSGYF